MFNRFKFAFFGIVVLLAFFFLHYIFDHGQNQPEALEDVVPTFETPLAIVKYFKELSSLNKLVRKHQQNYGNVDSYSDKHAFVTMDTDTWKLIGGELLMFSRMQNLNPKDAQKAAAVEKEMAHFNENQITSDDSHLVKYIRKNWIRPPSRLQYNLQKPEHRDHSMGQSLVVDHILGQKKDGFFIECGALDGETRSNSLFFERFRGWRGLLIEADPINYQQLLKRNRKAYLVPSCIAITDYPAQMNFILSRNQGTITNKNGILTQCFPIYSILFALNITTVDFFSLDVEGAELQVLKTIPFDKLDIKVLAVEFVHTYEGKKVLNTFMQHRGYVPALEVKHKLGVANDVVFIKEKYLYSILAQSGSVNLNS